MHMGVQAMAYGTLLCPVAYGSPLCPVAYGTPLCPVASMPVKPSCVQCCSRCWQPVPSLPPCCQAVHDWHVATSHPWQMAEVLEKVPSLPLAPPLAPLPWDPLSPPRPQPTAEA